MANKFVVQLIMESFQPEYLTDDYQFKINKDKALRFDSVEFADNHLKVLFGDDYVSSFSNVAGRKSKIQIIEDSHG